MNQLGGYPSGQLMARTDKLNGPPSLLTCVLGELAVQLKELHDIRARLEVVSDRILGSRPQAPDGGEKNDLVANNYHDKFRAYINSLTSAINDIKVQATRLEEL